MARKMVVLSLSEDLKPELEYWKNLKEKQFTDCKIDFKNSTILAHRMILSAASPYFKEIFKNNEKLTTLRFPEFSKDIFEKAIELIYKWEIEVPRHMIESFKLVAIKLQLEVYFDENEDVEEENLYDDQSPDVSADYDVRDSSTSVFEPFIPTIIRFDKHANSTFVSDTEHDVNSFSTQSVVEIPVFDRTLSPKEASRRFRNHRPIRGRKSLMNFTGPWKCKFCPQAPYFSSKREKTEHELYCSFNLTALDFMVCDQCGRRFKRKFRLQQHLLNHF